MAVTTVERGNDGVCYKYGKLTGEPKGFLYCPECEKVMRQIVQDKDSNNE